ncbi:hypothetical protein ACOSP7_021252 [Xanthoceras sorbifolium]
MRGRRSQEGELLPLNDNINRVNRIAYKPIDSNSSTSESEMMEERVDEAERRQMQNEYEEPVMPPVMRDYALPVIETSPSCILLDEMSRNYELKNIHFNMLPYFHGAQQEASTRKLEVQVGQLAEALQQQVLGKFPSQPEQSKAVTVLRSGKVVNNKVGDELSNEFVNDAGTGILPDSPVTKEKEVCHPTKEPILPKAADPFVPRVPFPGRLQKSKNDLAFKDIYDILSKVNVNLPLLEMIQKMPAYAKFFKELNTRKRHYGHNERVMIFYNLNGLL